MSMDSFPKPKPIEDYMDELDSTVPKFRQSPLEKVGSAFKANIVDIEVIKEQSKSYDKVKHIFLRLNKEVEDNIGIRKAYVRMDDDLRIRLGIHFMTPEIERWFIDKCLYEAIDQEKDYDFEVTEVREDKIICKIKDVEFFTILGKKYEEYRLNHPKINTESKKSAA